MKKIILRIIAICILIIPAFAYAADLNVASIADIQANCQYFPNSHTYYCTEKLNWAPSGSASVQETNGPVVLNYTGTVFAPNSVSGTFTGANPLTINVGGNCAPKDAKIDITGICTGTGTLYGDCNWLPEVNITRGIFQKIEAGSSCKVCSSYSNTYKQCAPGFTLPSGINCGGLGCGVGYDWQTGKSIGCPYHMFFGYEYGCQVSCSATSTSPLDQGAAATGSCGTTTSYTPCTYNPATYVNSMIFDYGGLVLNTQTKTVALSNFKPGANTISFSSGESGKFNYNIKWTEVTSPTGSCTSSSNTKAYHMTSGNAYQSADGAKILNASFDMKFDSLSSDTTVALLRDDTNPIVSARIYQYDGSNLRIEIPGYGIVSNNIQPNKWYTVRIILNEVSNTLNADIISSEYPAISKTYTTPAGLQAVKWISVTSNGMWMDNIDIAKKDAGGAIISSYTDDFESYTAGDSVLYSSGPKFDKVNITNDLDDLDFDGSNRKNIIFKANDAFESKNIILSGVNPGSPGNLEIAAKSITTGNLYTDSASESKTSDHISGCGAGTIKLTGDIVFVPYIRGLSGHTHADRDDGYCRQDNSESTCGGAGIVYIAGNKTTIGTLDLYAPNLKIYAGSGGYVNINSKEADISKINVYGGCGMSSGSGGTVILKGDRINASEINANGCSATGDEYCLASGKAGSGGSITINARDYAGISKIYANGGNGYSAGAGGNILLSTTNVIVPTEIQANGAMGRVGTFGKESYIKQTDASPGGTVRLFLDSLQSSVSVSAKGGGASCVNTGGDGYCALSKAGTGGLIAIFNDTSLGGTITLDNSGGNKDNTPNCPSVERPDCTTTPGPAGNFLQQKRTWPGFIGLNTSIVNPSFTTYRIKVNDLWADKYVKQNDVASEDYTFNGTLIGGIESSMAVRKIDSALIGYLGNKLNISLGKEYQLEITASVCDPFDKAGCSHSTDKLYTIPFTEY